MKSNLRVYFIVLVIIAVFIAVPGIIYADDSAASPIDLADKVKTAMMSKSSTYAIQYTGDVSIKNNVKSMFTEIFSSDDYLHYTTKSYGATIYGAAGNLTMKFNFSYWETLEQSLFVEAKVAEVLNQIITPDMNDYQKEKAIHDWIVSNVAYDVSLGQHSAYAALVPPYKTVCQGYSLLAHKMLNEAGIEARIIEGKAGSQNHSWLLVNLDGVYYHLDPTWNDPVPDVQDRIKYDYFNLTDEEIKANHSWTKPYPEASTPFVDTLKSKIENDAENAEIYQSIINDLGLEYIEDNLTASDSLALNSMIQEAIKEEKNTIKVRYTGMSIIRDIKEAVQGAGNVTNYSYSYTDYIRTIQVGDVILELNFSYESQVSVTGITLSESSITIDMGKSSEKLIPTVMPSDASNKNVKWSSSDTSIATVLGGVIKGVSGGDAIITVETVDGGIQAQIQVTVSVPVSRVRLDKAYLQLKTDSDDVQLQATVFPEDASDKDIVWSSNSENVTVDENGLVHAVAPGKAVITATSRSDPFKKAVCTVVVPVTVQEVSFAKDEITLKLGQAPIKMIPVITPANAPIKTVKWSSSDASITTVGRTGNLMAVSEGTATITATSIDGNKSASITVTVIRGVTSVTVSKKLATLKIGDPDLLLEAAVLPDNATIKDILWTSSNVKIATVDENGSVHAVAPGKVIITAYSKQDGTKRAACTITVPVPVSGIDLTTTIATLKVGQIGVRIGARIIPYNAAMKKVEWSSSDPSVLAVSASGVVTPIKEGAATISATTVDGGFSDSVVIKVIYPVSAVVLDKTIATMKVGDPDLTLKATVLPDRATSKYVEWKSSNPAVATVDDNGVVHAISYGKTVISAVSKQDPYKKGICSITVK
ncbi:Ig-like domain-containing protein [Pseudobacteroides cellulosolvens]|uniref:Ig domain protein group 2 domain protein n=1 Tax=Pseudobacteroides cellulosolvens ATCC 35603 = DSM 2933 TaxID=398512 RepID=A0A0L6JS32_9FIRM|nr:Ig-like domain-containing protein [Pseudobacteroides cellulosolvens]KNY28608.1 Ig domain protein group 2 domain protein [Pseudobacteroides cellulosolvens ATCC 35603 = DSM 2933]